MPRQLSIEYPGATCHVMNRGNRREIIVRDDQYSKAFLERLEMACQRNRWQIHVFVLMREWLVKKAGSRAVSNHDYRVSPLGRDYAEADAEAWISRGCDALELDPATDLLFSTPVL